MSNLLQIEQDFLNNPAVRQAINLTEINRAQRNVQNAQKRKFEHTMTLAGLVTKAVEWFDSEEGKRTFADEGIEWSKADFGLKVFGWQKSFFYKVIKAGNLDQRIVDAFNRKCDEAGDDAQRSLAGLLKFAQNIDLDSLEISEDATEEEIAQAEADAIESAEVETREERVATIFTMTWKNPAGRGVSVRIDENGQIITQNEGAEIAQALQFFMSQIGMNN